MAQAPCRRNLEVRATAAGVGGGMATGPGRLGAAGGHWAAASAEGQGAGVWEGMAVSEAGGAGEAAAMATVATEEATVEDETAVGTAVGSVVAQIRGPASLEGTVTGKGVGEEAPTGAILVVAMPVENLEWAGAWGVKGATGVAEAASVVETAEGGVAARAETREAMEGRGEIAAV